jgi:acetate kinase
VRILVVNAGSSSVKLRVIGDGDLVEASEDLAAVDPAGSAGVADWASDHLLGALRGMGDVDAVGHRLVHGGTEFTAAVRVDDAVTERLKSFSDLAPLHQPASIAALRSAMAAVPEVPHVACFDTAFHATLPPAAATYALPRAWRERWPLRRFGFHGLSHAYAARRAAELLHRPPEGLRIVTCHLGAGASLAAVDGGRSIDTTMGFTPLEGLVMATRSGSVDPGLLLWLQEHAGLSVEDVAKGLERDGGLAGLAGTADMRKVLATLRDSPDARLAHDVYVHRLRGSIAAMAAAMNGLDALVFTGGVGENAGAIRAATVAGLEFLGLAIDAGRNEVASGDREIGPEGKVPAVLVVVSREDLEIARQVRELLAG